MTDQILRPVDEPLWSAQELADHLQMDVETVHRWVREGRGPAVVKIGRNVRYRPQAVRDWISSNERGSDD